MKRQNLLLLLASILTVGCSPRPNGPPPPPPLPYQGQPPSKLQPQAQDDFSLEDDSGSDEAAQAPTSGERVGGNVVTETSEFRERRSSLDQAVSSLDQSMRQTEAQMSNRCMLSDFRTVKAKYSLILEEISDLEALAQIDYDRSVAQTGSGPKVSKSDFDASVQELATIKSAVSKAYQGFVTRYSNSSSECADIAKSAENESDDGLNGVPSGGQQQQTYLSPPPQASPAAPLPVAELPMAASPVGFASVGGRTSLLKSQDALMAKSSEIGVDELAVQDAYQISQSTGGIVGLASGIQDLPQALQYTASVINTQTNSDPADLEIVFAIDYSVSMGRAIEALMNQIGDLAKSFSPVGTSVRKVRFGISTFGQIGREAVDLDLTMDVAQVRGVLRTLWINHEVNRHSDTSGEGSYSGLVLAAKNIHWESTNRRIILITDEPSRELQRELTSVIEEAQSALKKDGVQTSVYSIIIGG